VVVCNWWWLCIVSWWAVTRITYFVYLWYTWCQNRYCKMFAYFVFLFLSNITGAWTELVPFKMVIYIYIYVCVCVCVQWYIVFIWIWIVSEPWDLLYVKLHLSLNQMYHVITLRCLGWYWLLYLLLSYSSQFCWVLCIRILFTCLHDSC